MSEKDNFLLKLHSWCGQFERTVLVLRRFAHDMISFQQQQQRQRRHDQQYDRRHPQLASKRAHLGKTKMEKSFGTEKGDFYSHLCVRFWSLWQSPSRLADRSRLRPKQKALFNLKSSFQSARIPSHWNSIKMWWPN